MRLGEYRCLQRKRIREIREIRVGDQEGSGQDEQASVQGGDLTLNEILEKEIDWDSVNTTLSILREKSLKFLEYSLS